MHPFAAPLGVLNRGERYDAILDEHGDVARSQLVCALQVHVAVGGADATLAVYNALRGHLPELAALAANAPFHAGRDTGFASIRPLIGGLLPRQGVPPAIPSWAEFAEMLRWAGDPKTWWFELRPHVAYGTLELRVCDTQTTLAEAAAIAAVRARARGLARRSATRPGTRRSAGGSSTTASPPHVTGSMPRSPICRRASGGPVREILRERLETLAPVAERLGCATSSPASRS